eukprot:4325130-Pleurochrysis_carterae.AAC.1
MPDHMRHANAYAPPAQVPTIQRELYDAFRPRVLRIFLSSTFVDMSLERNIVLKEYVPRVRRAPRCRSFSLL